MAAKVRCLGDYDFNGVKGVAYFFNCPACKYGHQFVVPPWQFNGDLEKPTVQGSIKTNRGESQPLCHSFVKDGMIQFLDDCTHALKGHTVEIPDWDEPEESPTPPEDFKP